MTRMEEEQENNCHLKWDGPEETKGPGESIPPRSCSCSHSYSCHKQARTVERYQSAGCIRTNNHEEKGRIDNTVGEDE